ncbi:MAG: hybrid sensor histidine kinase/response regulator [Mycobacteriales bacterium]
MPGWGDDPELVATFRAEVEERVASLQAGLLKLESVPNPRQVVAGLFRDAHTVKGSARMLGLDGVLQVAHSAEDLLGALRDGRLGVRRDIVDLLLTACEGIARAMPGAPAPVSPADLDALVAALHDALAGTDPVSVPTLATASALGEDEAEPEVTARHRASESMRVAAVKVYDLLDVVGEVELGARRVEQTTGTLLGLAADQARWAASLRDVVLRARLSLPEDAELALHRLTSLTDAVATTSRGLRELVETHLSGVALVRDSAMGLAMVPLRRALGSLPVLVREVAGAGGKDVRLETTGEDVELDKQVLDSLGGVIEHLVTNAIDHGCESPAERIAAGKPAQAVVSVTARSASGTVVVEVADDGAGVDEAAVITAAVARGALAHDATPTGAAVYELLFLPALSTSGAVTETSGRGVGLDVVRSAVENLGGTVEVRSEAGVGTMFVLTLPVTLGVLRCLVARVGSERYAIPVPGVVESIGLRDAELHVLAGAQVVIRHGQSLPLLDLGDALSVPGTRAPRAALVVRYGDRQLAWAVDRLEGELELVVKDLGSYIGRVPLVSGATIDGDGSVICLVDLRELADRVTTVGRRTSAPREHADGGGHDRPDDGPLARRARVLVVEDSVGVRELERVILEGAGYQVETAVDGLDGASRLRAEPADLVVSDVEMPGMDGFALTRTIRRTKGVGAGAGDHHDVTRRGGRAAGRSGGWRERLPAQERVRPEPADRDGPAPHRSVAAGRQGRRSRR